MSSAKFKKETIVEITKIIRNTVLNCSTASSFINALILSLFLFSGLIGWQSALAQQDEFPGEKIVHLFEEPRHRTVFQKDQLYLINMQLRPGDESLPHTHDQAILLTYISRPEGPQFGELRTNIDYVTEAFTHKINNPGPNLFHILALVHDGNGVPIDNNDSPTGMQIEPDIENNWFRAYRFELAPGETTLTQHHINPTIIALGTEGTAYVSREDGITRELTQPGDWTFRDAGASYRITNVSDMWIAVIVNEGRLQHSK